LPPPPTTTTVNGYVVSPGASGQGGSQLWMFAQDCPPLPFLYAADPTLSKNLTAYGDAVKKFDSVAVEIEIVKDLTDSISPDSALEKKFEQALGAGGLFPNVRRPLARALATHAPAYLPPLLGHLARA
jgi:hypothetical protein